MFRRNFMKVFPIRKYGNITAKSGSISSDIWIVNQKEINIGRIIIYLAVGGIMLNSFDNFHTMDEIVGHLPRPTAFTRYEAKTPKEVFLSNLPIIEGFEAIDKLKELQKSSNYDQ